MDVNKTHWKEAGWKPDKSAMFYVVQILEATPNKITAVSPLTSHLTKHTRRWTRYICQALLKKSAAFCCGLQHMANTFIDHPCADTGCRLDDLPEAVDDKDGWREWVRKLSSQCDLVKYTYIYIYIYIHVYRSKSSKSHSERKALHNFFFCFFFFFWFFFCCGKTNSGAMFFLELFEQSSCCI